MIKNVVNILEMLGDRFEDCVSVYPGNDAITHVRVQRGRTGGPDPPPPFPEITKI